MMAREYQPGLCAAIEKQMAEGFSLSAASAAINASREHVDRWAVEHPEFASAIARGREARLAFFQAHASKVRENGGRSGQKRVIAHGIASAERDLREHGQKISGRRRFV